MAEFAFEPGDVMAGENPAKVAEARARFTLRVAETAADFDVGYRLLHEQFAAANEIERREVLERWFDAGSLSPEKSRFQARYHMLLAWDGDRVAAVRDCFSAIDAETRGVVVLMSHSLVLPDWRRTGVAALLRASPVGFARRHAAARGVEPSEVVLVAEMEPVEPHAEATLVRLAAYIGAGFRVVPPWIVPYAQPDFRDLDALGVPAKPIPFMLLVRQVGEEDLPTITWLRIRAILNSLVAIHGPSIHPDQLTDIRWQVVQNNDPTPGASIPLYAPNPRKAEDLAPLLRSVLAPHYPPEWVGDPGDADADKAALAAALG